MLICFAYFQVGIAGAQTSPGADDFLYAQKLFKEGYYELCITQLQSFMARHPEAQEVADSWKLIGEANLALAHHAAAEAAFQNFELRYPQHQAVEEVRLRLAESQKAQGKLAEAALSYQRVVFFHPRSGQAPLAQYSACQLWHQAGKAQKAREGLYHLLEFYPESQQRLPGHLLLVQSFADAGELERALLEAENLFRAFPEGKLNAEAYYVLGRLQEQVGQAQLAEENYLKIVEQFPRETWISPAQARLAELYFARGEADQAVAALKRAASGAQASTANQFTLRAAEMSLAVGKVQEAETALEKFDASTADSATNLIYFYTLGLAREKAGNAAGAAEAFRRALRYSAATEAKSDSSSAAPVHRRERSYWRGAHAEFQAKRYEAALTFCRQYLREYPEGRFRDAMLMLEGDIQSKGLEDLALAQRAYDRLLADHPHSALVDEAQFALAEIYESVGEAQLAQRQWQRFLKLYPASEHFQAAQRRLRLLEESRPSDSPATIAQLTETMLRLSEGGNREALPVALSRLHFERREYRTALRYCHQASPEEREAQFLMAASYFRLSELERLRGRANAAWEDSARTLLRALAQEPTRDRFAEQAGVMLAHLQFNQATARDAAMLTRADSMLAWFGENRELDFLRLWAATTRMSLASANDPLEAERIVLALGQVAAPENSPYRNEALFRLAEWHFQRGDSAAAKRNLEQLRLSQTPDLYQARGQLLLARWLVKQKIHAEALAQLEAMQQQYFYSAYADSAQRLKAQVLIATGRFREALRTLEGFSANEPGNGTDGADLTRAQTAESAGDYPQAIQAYLRFLNDHPNSPEAAPALLAAARLTQRAGAERLAAGYFEECFKRFPGTEYSQEARVRLADLHFDKKDFTGARSLYLDALNENPDAPFAKEAMKKSIICLYKTKNPGQAEAETKNFEQRFKGEREALAEIQYAAGELAMESKDFVSAERIFKKVGKDFRDTPSGILGDYGLGKALLIQNKTEEALETLTGIPRRYPNHPFLPTVYLGLGDFYQAQQQWDNAITAFNQVVKDSSFDSNYRLGIRSLLDVYDRMGLKDKALALARHYTTRFPEDKKAFDLRIKIGLLLIDLAQYDDALAHLRRLKPFADLNTEPEIQYYLGKAYMNSGRFELAIAEFLRVKFYSQPTKLPWDVIALYDAANSYLRLNNCAMARKLFGQIVREQGAASDFGRFANAKMAELKDCAEPN